jgi:hypothetical protein
VYSLSSNGNATFTGDVQAGGNPSQGLNVGASLSAFGRVTAARSLNDDAVWVGYKQGSSASQPTSRINADGSATFTGTVTENASDRKFKENIVDAPAQLADVSALQLRTWDWNDLAPGNEDRNDRRSMGLVAQEAELIDSNLVYAVNEGEDTYKAVDYKVLTMKLLGAVKELSDKNTALVERVAALEAN